MAKTIQVIQSEITRGDRNVIQYHDMDGNFLAEYDGWADTCKEREEDKVETAAEGTVDGTTDGTTESKKKREYYVTVCRGDSDGENMQTPHPIRFSLLMEAWKLENEQESS